jgi:hypothetical protein
MVDEGVDLSVEVLCHTIEDQNKKSFDHNCLNYMYSSWCAVWGPRSGSLQILSVKQSARRYRGTTASAD